MNQVSTISSTAGKPLVRRLPLSFEGVDLKFCRNPLCATFGIPPDPFQRRRGGPPAPDEAIRGVVAGKKHEDFFRCPSCGRTSRVRNNKAIAEEDRRRERLHELIPAAPSCPDQKSFAHGMEPEKYPEFYRSFGKTAKGDPRWQCPR
ncbi:hypothetical protein [Paracoccus spongiarum]|uniref:Uncharacterized protein n=1 Tax=Paracoccus spongiarum TaxID=3064387 RepID=A0ABT9JDS5_9RHOB|nr:hypothetical protein [Paracoccus sp. 2205BS29-5]MDP5307975.1 hypothetical protein [Paracoccus sp. 2205BS29-5]